MSSHDALACPRGGYCQVADTPPQPRQCVRYLPPFLHKGALFSRIWHIWRISRNGNEMNDHTSPPTRATDGQALPSKSRGKEEPVYGTRVKGGRHQIVGNHREALSRPTATCVHVASDRGPTVSETTVAGQKGACRHRLPHTSAPASHSVRKDMSGRRRQGHPVKERDQT